MKKTFWFPILQMCKLTFREVSGSIMFGVQVCLTAKPMFFLPKKKRKKERNVSCDSLPGLPHSDLPALSYSWVNQVSACGVGSVEHSGPSWDPFKRRANLSIISGLTESLIEAFFPLLGVNDHLEEKDWDLRPAGSVAQVTVLFEFGILICKTGSTKPL